MKVNLSRNIIYSPDIDSTNLHAFRLIKHNNLRNGVIVADYQSAGKGRRSNVWHSERKKNLLMSIILECNIDISKQFEINRLISLSLLSCLNNLGVSDVSIKWPNDILVHNKKIAGILIENKIQGDNIIHTIIGIGFNINQTKFPKFNREATSLYLQKDQPFDINIILDQLLYIIEKRYIRYVQSKDIVLLQEDYMSHLYLRDHLSIFFIHGKKIQGILRSVSEKGFLMLEIDGKLQSFDANELSFLK